MRTWLLSFFTLAAAALVLAPLAADDPTEKKTAKGPVGQPAYEFSLEDLDGAPMKLKDMKGKVVLIDFFETWCPACNSMMPGIVAINAKYKDKGLVTIAMDREKRGDKPEAIKKFVAKHKIDFPVVMLTGSEKTKIWNEYDVATGIPHYIIIDRKGVVRYKRAGGNTGEIENTVKKLLDERS